MGGMHPTAARNGRARFEMRLVSQAGNVVASDFVVRARSGQLIPPAVLRVAVADASSLTLQLRVNNENSGAHEDRVVWGGPILQCEGRCPCLPAGEEPTETGRQTLDVNFLSVGSALIAASISAACCVCLLRRITLLSLEKNDRGATQDERYTAAPTIEMVGTINALTNRQDAATTPLLVTTLATQGVDTSPSAQAVSETERLTKTKERVIGIQCTSA